MESHGRTIFQFTVAVSINRDGNDNLTNVSGDNDQLNSYPIIFERLPRWTNLLQLRAKGT